jgi:predicted MFS family arabinose efflux permease
MLRGLKDGAVYAASLLPVRLLLPIVALISFMATPYQALMPIFAAEVFHGDARMLGFLIGAAGLGGSSGLVYLASRKDVRGLARHIVFGAFLTGVSLMAFGESTLLWLSLTAIMLTGFGIILVGMGTSMILQTIVADEKRGRVMSFFTVAFLGVSPLGSFVAGALAHKIGAGHTLFAGGTCCVFGAALLWRQLPRLRANMREIYASIGVSGG